MHMPLLMPFLANTTAGANESLGSVELMNDSVALAQKTAESWNQLWLDALKATPIASGAATSPSTLWDALCALGLILSTISILYVAFTEGKEIIEKQAWGNLVSMFAWPLVIVFFLAGNGSLLSKTVLMVRGVGYAQVQQVLKVQISGTGQTVAEAVAQVTGDMSLKQQVEQQFTQCQGRTGEDYTNCVNTATENAKQVLKNAPKSASDMMKDFLLKGLSIVNPTAGAAVNLALNAPSIMMQVAKAILWALQWAFVNLLEASLLLSALFSPIAMGLSLLPMGARPIVAWLTGFISLFGLQIGYNIIVGLAAIVMSKAGTVGVSDLGFLMFISIFAPILATVIAAGGGMAAYNAMNSGAKQMISFGADLVAAPVRLLAPR